MKQDIEKQVEAIVNTDFNNRLINCPWVLMDGTISVLPEVVASSKEMYKKQIITLIQKSNEDAEIRGAEKFFNWCCNNADGGFATDLEEYLTKLQDKE